jgi:RNA polymerase sigma-70 factor (ECF subfamily)
VDYVVATRCVDHVDWSNLYATHSGEIGRYLERLVGDADIASELTQETFVRGMRAQASLHDLNATRPWLFRIATNLARKHLRRRRIWRFVAWSQEHVSPARDTDDDVVLVREALRAISPKEATTLVLHYHAGFSRREIAEMEGVGEEAVTSRLARGRQHFLEAYNDLQRGGDG